MLLTEKNQSTSQIEGESSALSSDWSESGSVYLPALGGGIAVTNCCFLLKVLRINELLLFISKIDWMIFFSDILLFLAKNIMLSVKESQV